MAVRTKEEILASIQARFADDSSDETLTFLEDVSDTFSDLETRANGDGTDWKAEAKRIDEAWREKYKARFFSKSQDDDPDDDSEIPDDVKPMRYEDLFKEG